MERLLYNSSSHERGAVRAGRNYEARLMNLDSTAHRMYATFGAAPDSQAQRPSSNSSHRDHDSAHNGRNYESMLINADSNFSQTYGRFDRLEEDLNGRDSEIARAQTHKAATRVCLRAVGAGYSTPLPRAERDKLEAIGRTVLHDAQLDGEGPFLTFLSKASIAEIVLKGTLRREWDSCVNEDFPAAARSLRRLLAIGNLRQEEREKYEDWKAIVEVGAMMTVDDLGREVWLDGRKVGPYESQ